MILSIGTVLLPIFANPTSDLIGWTIDNEEKKVHKQTYLEYVQERLAVEKLLK